MKVSLERTGGFTGMRVSVVVDTDSLSPEEAAHLRDLVRSAGVLTMQAPAPSEGRPDQFSYRLTIAEGDRGREIFVREPNIPTKLRPLLEWLVRRSRKIT
ncbi:MAG: hypothetical protein HYX84_07210 [Chloroflexi bacterium]|nr:hypothetical protein [Chloroflexota bacterium]